MGETADAVNQRRSGLTPGPDRGPSWMNPAWPAEASADVARAAILEGASNTGTPPAPVDAMGRVDADADAGNTDDATGAPEIAEIRTDVEQTRSEMGYTIDAIQRKLDPDRLTARVKEAVKDATEHVAEQAKEVVHDATIGRAEEAMGATVRKAEDVVTNARETARDFGSAVVETIRDNPLPAALAGIGLGWLFVNGRRSESHQESYRPDGGGRSEGGRYGGGRYESADARRYTGTGFGTGYRGVGPGFSGSGYGSGTYRGERFDTGQSSRDTDSVASRAAGAVGDAATQAKDTVDDLAGRTKDTVTDVAGQARDTVEQAADQAWETASDLASSAQYRAGRAQDQVQRFVRENPLASGAVALGLGAAIGLILPRTEREDQLLGETRDNVMRQAQDTAKDVGQRVQHVASEAEHAAAREAEAQDLTTASQGSASKPA